MTPEPNDDDLRIRALESALTRIASETLNASGIEPDSDLFAAHGLQSLAAVRIALAAQAEDIALGIADIYEHRSVRRIARHLVAAPAGVGDDL